MNDRAIEDLDEKPNYKLNKQINTNIFKKKKIVVMK